MILRSVWILIGSRQVCTCPRVTWGQEHLHTWTLGGVQVTCSETLILTAWDPADPSLNATVMQSELLVSVVKVTQYTWRHFFAPSEWTCWGVSTQAPHYTGPPPPLLLLALTPALLICSQGNLAQFLKSCSMAIWRTCSSDANESFSCTATASSSKTSVERKEKQWLCLNIRQNSALTKKQRTPEPSLDGEMQKQKIHKLKKNPNPSLHNFKNCYGEGCFKNKKTTTSWYMYMRHW